ncbi:hypothetical protein Q4Q35_17200 [Flavivirga aquimarina]|uniref:CHRD domain-containing protein n=1 Tax=Flavivirga aquimarina TaxID=2027862 RepID=A0ABT8WES1_9FLAO|nr:hypothetical protein [Flavivirga aquimarina]MDO5971543.1 hypothetical protein [Flavivirga aquimarina]
MNRSNYYFISIALISLIGFLSCQKDSFPEPETTPLVYSFNIPNKIHFKLSQQSENSSSKIPYSNSLNIKNIGNDIISANYAIFAFKNNSKNYNNLAFIKEDSISNLVKNDTTSSISLHQSNTLFSKENTIISVLNFNEENKDHPFNGLFRGELNVFNVTETDTTFLRSITCTGVVDYLGEFNLFTQDEDEENIVYIKGNFNSDYYISGKIINNEGASLSQLVNIETQLLKLIDKNTIEGSIKFTENSEERILKVSLTR